MPLTTFVTVFGTITAFVAGGCIGSYLNVCIYRWPRGMNTSHPRRSICFSCEQQIAWYDNIPILSWFLLRGRCRRCGATFSIRYAMVELLTATLMALLFYRFGPTPAFFVYAIWTAMMLIGSFIDLDHTILPDRITITGSVVFPLAVLALDLTGKSEGLVVPDWPGAFFGALFGAGFIYLIRFLGTVAFGREAMGFGDVKLMAMNGALLGWWRSVLVIMGLGPVLALTTVLVLRLLSRFKIERYTEIPFGPFLCLGSYLAIFWGDRIVEWWLSLPPGFAVVFDHPWRWFGW